MLFDKAISLYHGRSPLPAIGLVLRVRIDCFATVRTCESHHEFRSIAACWTTGREFYRSSCRRWRLCRMLLKAKFHRVHPDFSSVFVAALELSECVAMSAGRANSAASHVRDIKNHVAVTEHKTRNFPEKPFHRHSSCFAWRIFVASCK